MVGIIGEVEAPERAPPGVTYLVPWTGDVAQDLHMEVEVRMVWQVPSRLLGLLRLAVVFVHWAPTRAYRLKHGGSRHAYR